jgi:hypothetical protein
MALAEHHDMIEALPADRADQPLCVGVLPGCAARLYAATLSSVSAPGATIIKASSGNGRCNTFASFHGARIQTYPLPLSLGYQHRLSYFWHALLEGATRHLREQRAETFGHRRVRKVGFSKRRIGKVR